VALDGKVPTVLAGGHTVFAPEAGTWGKAFQVSSKALTGFTFTRELTTNNLILNIKTAVGYVPPDVTVIGFMVVADDLDSGGSALVQSLYLGSTLVCSGITAGAGGTSAVYAALPTRTTANTPLYVNTTTSATTPAAGTFSVTALYYA
jgi:hypothetical protein